MNARWSISCRILMCHSELRPDSRPHWVGMECGRFFCFFFAQNNNMSEFEMDAWLLLMMTDRSLEGAEPCIQLPISKSGGSARSGGLIHKYYVRIIRTSNLQNVAAL